MFAQLMACIASYQKANGPADKLMSTMAGSFVDYPGKTQLLMDTLVDSGVCAVAKNVIPSGLITHQLVGLDQEHVDQNVLDFAKRWVTDRFDADVVNQQIAREHEVNCLHAFAVKPNAHLLTRCWLGRLKAR